MEFKRKIENKRIIDDLNEKRKELIELSKNDEKILSYAKDLLDENLEEFISILRKDMLSQCSNRFKYECITKGIKTSLSFKTETCIDNLHDLVKFIETQYNLYLSGEILGVLINKCKNKIIIMKPYSRCYYNKPLVLEDLITRLNREGLNVSIDRHISGMRSEEDVIDIEVSVPSLEIPEGMREITYVLKRDRNNIITTKKYSKINF